MLRLVSVVLIIVLVLLVVSCVCFGCRCWSLLLCWKC